VKFDEEFNKSLAFTLKKGTKGVSLHSINYHRGSGFADSSVLVWRGEKKIGHA
jgi:hypothetical protein